LEISPVAIEQFFNENEIEYDVNPFELMKGTVYTSKNGNIRIYCGDFFLFGPSAEMDFDGIWVERIEIVYHHIPVHIR
jgi:hypothetical protein